MQVQALDTEQEFRIWFDLPALAAQAGHPADRLESIVFKVNKEDQTICCLPRSVASLSFAPYPKTYQASRRFGNTAPAAATHLCSNLQDILGGVKPGEDYYKIWIIAHKRSIKMASRIWNSMWKQLLPHLNQRALKQVRKMGKYVTNDSYHIYNMLCTNEHLLQLAETSPLAYLLLMDIYSPSPFNNERNNLKSIQEVLLLPFPELIKYLLKLKGNPSGAIIHLLRHAPLVICIIQLESWRNLLDSLQRENINLDHLRKIRSAREWVLLFCLLEKCWGQQPLIDIGRCIPITKQVISDVLEFAKTTNAEANKFTYKTKSFLQYLQDGNQGQVLANLHQAYRKSIYEHRRQVAQTQREAQERQLALIAYNNLPPEERRNRPPPHLGNGYKRVSATFPPHPFIIKQPENLSIDYLSDSDALYVEGEIMEHCVGWSSGYTLDCQVGRSFIFSIKMLDGSPIATLQMDENGEPLQLRGPHNIELDHRLRKEILSAFQAKYSVEIAHQLEEEALIF